MAAATLDIGYLSGYLSLPQQTLKSALDAPTAELVRSVLDAVTTKAREHDELSADKLRVDIELENAVRSSETRIEGLKASVEKAQKTVEEVRIKLTEEENTRSSLESELQTLKSSSTTSTSEVETLRTRIASLESANRDTVALLESKTTANDNISQELQKQHQKGLELSQQITALQQSVQNANSAASSAKFREQSLKQEVDLAKQNAEWFEGELKTKSAEALKYRKEKGARLAELQRLNEDANSNIEALKRTEQALRNRLDEVQKKAEESFTKVQQLQEAAAKTEEGFRQELESATRLVELQTQQSDTHRNRLKEVEAELEKAKDDAAGDVGRCRQEAAAERQDREQAEHRISELEAEVDRLEALVSQPRNGSVPGTPRGLNGSTFGRSGSPAQFNTPGSTRKSAITATQAIDELYKVKAQLANEKRRSERLAAEVDDMMRGLEAKVPAFDELQAENERLQAEVIAMSEFVDQSGKESDHAKKELRKVQSESSTTQAENNILRQQLRDLSAQIKMLLYDLDAKERGIDALSAAERSQLERLARGEVDEEALEGLTDTDRFISQRLTVFRSIKELQDQNQELLKITRQLGAQMESEEAVSAKNQAAKDHDEVKSLQAKIENYKDELKSMLTRSESYIKERDMFRRMLQHRGQLPPNSDLASMFGQSVDGNQNGLMQSTEQTPGGSANYPVLLRDLQAHFDQYREEHSIDRRTLKEQAEKLSLEKGALQGEIAKTSSQLTYANERYEMLQSNYTMLQNENSELQKRSQTLSEAAAKQDLRTQQVAEDLVEAKGLVESMRNENANLKAEKKIWKDIQDRLSQDNEGLMNERTRLNNLISNQQTLQNERELSDSETRRRLQTQVESLEAELSSTKRKLSDEVEDNKKAQLRKEYDAQQTQKRIDDLASSLSQVREELVAAKTTRDHLQSRVDELSIELKSAEERVEVLQPRPTPRANANSDGSDVTNGNIAPEEVLSREQELSIEVSELKRDLDLSKSELESAKSQMEQYKSISQSSEEELQSFNATQDQYREEMDHIIEEKDSKIRELQQRVDDISAELTTTNNELTTLRNQQADVAREVEEGKAVLEQEITRLRNEDARHSEAAKFHQQDLRSQAEIATKAQQDYEIELVKHAEAAKLLQNLRAEYNQLKSESAGLKADAESARVTLSQSESSWEERREQFEQELKELRTRRDDVNAQNKLLHQQLENVGSQISALQQSRSAATDAADAGSPGGGESTYDRTADGLRELNAFLRREKEIVEVQYELKVQESKRLQQQLDYTQSRLDESRLKLDQERRLHADGGRNAVAHKDLMEKLTELNLFRESSITLRNEARQAQAQLSEKTARVNELLEQIQPLENKIRELEHGKETTDGEMRLLQEDRDRWQKRTQDIISKYDRIDPAEMEQLKETIETLRTERDSLLEEKQPFQEKIEGLEAEKAQWQQSRQKIIDQAKERSRVQGKNIQDRTAERDAAVQEKESLQQQLSGLQEQLEAAVSEKTAAEQRLTSLSQELETVKSERDQALATKSQSPPSQAPAVAATEQSNNEALEQELAGLRKQLDEVTQVKVSLETQLKDLREQLQKANSERDAAVADASEARSKLATSASDHSGEDGNEDGQIDETPKNNLPEEERQALEERIATAEAKATEQEEKAAKIEEQMENTLKARSDKMKAALNKKLSESKEVQKKELEDHYQLKLEQEKQIWLAENKTATPLTVSTALSNPTNDGAAAAATPTAAPPVPATPSTPNQKQPSANLSGGTNLTDAQVRDLLSSNPTVKGILANNIKKKLEIETQKVKEEFEKNLSEAKEKAEKDQKQAVFLAEKKSVLRLNMSDNKIRTANGKLEIVETAAKETPTRPVSEVWEIAKVFKPALPTPAPAPAPVAVTGTDLIPSHVILTNFDSVEPANQANGTSVPKPEVKTEATAAAPEPVSQPSSIPSTSNGTAPSVPASNIPTASQPPNNGARTSGIPTARGGGNTNRGNRGMYQAGGRGGSGGSIGRGRGNAMGQRGGLNAGAQSYSPTGQGGGLKRPPPEGSIGGQGNAGKRPRGGGPNN
ncbi:Protein MLP1-like protein [Lachnellula suecica]|uniref:Protein MLP1-like protein n=1 Tax=Lachnellula suecica TaxID=602035 RepID=A0A8T9BZP6_9HELO|nr:Protein MLP1-like protein [Lachnellula suecica]